VNSHQDITSAFQELSYLVYIICHWICCSSLQFSHSELTPQACCWLQHQVYMPQKKVWVSNEFKTVWLCFQELLKDWCNGSLAVIHHNLVSQTFICFFAGYSSTYHFDYQNLFICLFVLSTCHLNYGKSLLCISAAISYCCTNAKYWHWICGSLTSCTLFANVELFSFQQPVSVFVYISELSLF
jgi:ABC-type glycerol-3-phosphate transport system permease component